MHHDYDNTASGFQLSLPEGAIPVDTHPYNETIRVQQHNNTFQKNQAVARSTPQPRHLTGTPTTSWKQMGEDPTPEL